MNEDQKQNGVSPCKDLQDQSKSIETFFSKVITEMTTQIHFKSRRFENTANIGEE